MDEGGGGGGGGGVCGWGVACKTDCCVTRLHSQDCSLFRRLPQPPSNRQKSAGAAESELNLSELAKLTGLMMKKSCCTGVNHQQINAS